MKWDTIKALKARKALNIDRCTAKLWVSHGFLASDMVMFTSSQGHAVAWCVGSNACLLTPGTCNSSRVLVLLCSEQRVGSTGSSEIKYKFYTPQNEITKTAKHVALVDGQKTCMPRCSACKGCLYRGELIGMIWHDRIWSLTHASMLQSQAPTNPPPMPSPKSTITTIATTIIYYYYYYY